jgi:sigma-B regulation protein RsbU (phosphoserine phosphatase)
MNNTPVNVLLIEDNPLDARLINEIMKSSRTMAYSIDCVDNLAEGLQRLSSHMYDAAFVDLSLSDSTGLETFKKIRAAAPRLPVIILTGTDDDTVALEALQAGAQDYLIKGQLTRNHLERSLSYALERQKILDELENSHQSLRTTKEELERALKSIRQELETAKLVQKAFLPQDISSLPGIEVAAMYVPCGSVGGDLYDVISLDDTRTAFMLLDVAGHGIPAALISAMAKLSFARNIKRWSSPMEIFEHVNAELVSHLPPERFITAIVGIFDASTKEFALARAGNPPAMLFHADTAAVDNLMTSGTFIGVFPHGKFEQVRIKLNPGDKLLLYTDGLVECMNEAELQFGRSHLTDIFIQCRNATPEETAAKILSAAKDFVGGQPYYDDMTFLVLKIS